MDKNHVTNNHIYYMYNFNKQLHDPRPISSPNRLKGFLPLDRPVYRKLSLDVKKDMNLI